MKTKDRKSARAKHARKWQADRNSAGAVIARVKPFNEAEQAQLQIPVYQAMQALLNGTAEDRHMGVLFTISAACAILGEQAGPLCVDVAMAAQHALCRAEARFIKTGRFGLDGEGKTALEDCIEYHNELLAVCTPIQMMDAIEEAGRRTTERKAA